MGEQSEAGTELNEPAGWLELFFDLVVVVSMAMLAEYLLEHSDLPGVARFVLLYAAIWFVWTQSVLYANVAEANLRVSLMLLVMAGVAVMAAAIPNLDEHANTFAVAFLLCRLLVTRGSMATGRILTSWPTLQQGGTIVLWFASLWVETPWKYVLWAVALAVDIVVAMLTGTDDQTRAGQLIDKITNQRRKQAEQHEGSRRRSRRGRPMPDLSVASIRLEHLDERLGVFVIIVLGEAVSQVIHAGAGQHWTYTFDVTAALAFVLMINLWLLTFSYGFSQAPHAELAALPPRIALPVHLVLTGAIVSLAAGLGEMTRHASERPEDSWRWIAAASLAAYFVATLVSAIASRAPWRWVVGWGVPCPLGAIVLGVIGGGLAAEWLMLCLTALVFWQVLYGRALFAQFGHGLRRPTQR